jgi:hypothetical protein
VIHPQISLLTVRNIIDLVVAVVATDRDERRVVGVVAHESSGAGKTRSPHCAMT